MGGIPWTKEEDQLLRKCIEQYGEGKWHRVPLLAGMLLTSFYYCFNYFTTFSIIITLIGFCNKY